MTGCFPVIHNIITAVHYKGVYKHMGSSEKENENIIDIYG